MKCFVANDGYGDIIEIPDPVACKIKKYRNQFLDWIYDKNNRHQYWVKGSDGKGGFFEGVCYDTTAFVEWLNNRVIKNKYDPAIIVERNLDGDACPEGMLRIFF